MFVTDTICLRHKAPASTSPEADTNCARRPYTLCPARHPAGDFSQRQVQYQ